MRWHGRRPSTATPLASRSVDLGLLEAGDVARHTFTLSNTTASTVEILGVHTSCGCEQAAVRVGECIEPGETISIPYTLSRYGIGVRRGTLTIDTSSDDPDVKRIVYTLSASFPRRIWTEPETIDFRNTGGNVAPEPIRLAVYAADPSLTSDSCRLSTSRQLASAELIAPISNRPTEDGPVRLSVLVTLRDDPPAGMTMDYLTLEFEGRPEDTLHVPVIAAIDTGVSVLEPSTVRFAPSPAPAAPLAATEEMD